MSQIQNVPEAKRPKPQNVPVTKWPKYKISQASTSKRAKIQNVTSLINIPSIKRPMMEWMPNVLDYETIFVSNSNTVNIMSVIF